MKLIEYTKNNSARIREVAEKAGCSSFYIWMIGKGKRTPSPKVAERIERATDGQVTRLELLYP